MSIVRFFGALGSVLAMGLLAGCATAPPVSDDTDWTNRVCESPAYLDILGNYAGSISTQDDFARACRWDTEITITGVSKASECKLTGNIAATPDQSEELQGDKPYLCSDVDAPTQFVVGLSDENLNHFGPSSVIVHMIDLLPTVNDDGVSIVNPIFQFEALTASGGKLITDAGYVLKRQ